MCYLRKWKLHQGIERDFNWFNTLVCYTPHCAITEDRLWELYSGVSMLLFSEAFSLMNIVIAVLALLFCPSQNFDSWQVDITISMYHRCAQIQAGNVKTLSAIRHHLSTPFTVWRHFINSLGFFVQSYRTVQAYIHMYIGQLDIYLYYLLLM